jgi:hypothetical protein
MDGATADSLVFGMGNLHWDARRVREGNAGR